MIYGIILALVVLGLGLYFAWNRKRPQRAFLNSLRKSWGQPRPVSDDMEFARIGIYDRLRARESANSLDDKTWNDLNLDEVFQFIDRTNSRVGQQFLFHLLRNPGFEEEPLRKLEQVVNCFYDVKLREGLQTELHRLNHKDALFLPYLFLEDLPQLGARRLQVLGLSVATLALFVAAIFSRKFLLPAFGLASINMLISLSYHRQLEGFIQSFRLLNVLIGTAGRVANKYAGSKISEQTEKLRDEVKHLSGLQRRTILFAFDRQNDDMLNMVYQYLNMVLLLDVNCFAFAAAELRARRENVTAIYEGLGYLDVAISVASVRQSNPRCIAPVFIARKRECSFKQIYHPLLESPVANDLRVDQKGLLLTGSNMSGKSTFVRTIGVNVVLAQTIHCCFAQEYFAPFLNVKACMGASDSLTESKSHYLAEVESVRVLVDSAKSGGQCLFLIDELFRGTNTVERVAAAKAILEYLNLGDNIVIAATHDLELAELLGQRYECHHFREIIHNEQMAFDYKLQEGTSSTRNAIAILRMMGYPKSIVAHALLVVDRLVQNGTRVRRQ